MTPSNSNTSHIYFSDFPGKMTEHWYTTHLVSHLGMGWTRVAIALGVQMSTVGSYYDFVHNAVMV